MIQLFEDKRFDSINTEIKYGHHIFGEYEEYTVNLLFTKEVLHNEYAEYENMIYSKINRISKLDFENFNERLEACIECERILIRNAIILKNINLYFDNVLCVYENIDFFLDYIRR